MFSENIHEYWHVAKISPCMVGATAQRSLNPRAFLPPKRAMQLNSLGKIGVKGIISLYIHVGRSDIREPGLTVANSQF
jgi:hypothetical protein